MTYNTLLLSMVTFGMASLIATAANYWQAALGFVLLSFISGLLLQFTDWSKK